jgi:hypothetical protein
MGDVERSALVGYLWGLLLLRKEAMWAENSSVLLRATTDAVHPMNGRRCAPTDTFVCMQRVVCLPNQEVQGVGAVHAEGGARNPQHALCAIHSTIGANR